MDSLIFELQIVFYFQLFLSANVRHNKGAIIRGPSREAIISYIYYSLLEVVL